MGNNGPIEKSNLNTELLGKRLSAHWHWCLLLLTGLWVAIKNLSHFMQLLVSKALSSESGMRLPANSRRHHGTDSDQIHTW